MKPLRQGIGKLPSISMCLKTLDEAEREKGRSDCPKQKKIIDSFFFMALRWRQQSALMFNNKQPRLWLASFALFSHCFIVRHQGIAQALPSRRERPQQRRRIIEPFARNEKGRNQFYKYQSNCLDSIYYSVGATPTFSKFSSQIK